MGLSSLEDAIIALLVDHIADGPFQTRYDAMRWLERNGHIWTGGGSDLENDIVSEAMSSWVNWNEVLDEVGRQAAYEDQQ
jgi:hypothetical protein